MRGSPLKPFTSGSPKNDFASRVWGNDIQVRGPRGKGPENWAFTNAGRYKEPDMTLNVHANLEKKNKFALF